MESITTVVPAEVVESSIIPQELKNPFVWGAATVGMTVGVVGVGLYARHKLKQADEEIESLKSKNSALFEELAALKAPAPKAEEAKAA